MVINKIAGRRCGRSSPPCQAALAQERVEWSEPPFDERWGNGESEATFVVSLSNDDPANCDFRCKAMSS